MLGCSPGIVARLSERVVVRASLLVHPARRVSRAPVAAGFDVDGRMPVERVHRSVSQGGQIGSGNQESEQAAA